MQINRDTDTERDTVFRDPETGVKTGTDGDTEIWRY
jgi:hypothetical protein